MSERMLILSLVEAGKLSIDEAQALLQALGENPDKEGLYLPFSGLQTIILEYADYMDND